MYKTKLVEEDIKDGKLVVATLEQSVKVTAAFWSFFEDEDDWSLVIVSPDVAEKGSTEVYKKLFAPLHNLQAELAPRTLNFWWDRIRIVSPANLTYKMLKQHAGPVGGPVREGPALDAYIYKMTWVNTSGRSGRPYRSRPGCRPSCCAPCGSRPV